MTKTQTTVELKKPDPRDGGDLEISFPPMVRLAMSTERAASLLRQLQAGLPTLKEGEAIECSYGYGDALIIDEPIARQMIPLLEKIVAGDVPKQSKRGRREKRVVDP